MSNIDPGRMVFLCIALGISMVFAACGTEQTKSPVSGDPPTRQADSGKRDIKMFWENYRMAQKFKAGQRWEEAEEYYLKALEIDKDHEDAWFNLGNVYLELNNYDQAKKCWHHIVQANPGSARAHMQLGRLYFSPDRPEICNLDSARIEFITTHEINRIVTGPLMLLGHIALVEGNSKEAYEYFSSVKGSDTKNVEAHFLLGYVKWKDGNYKLSQELFSKAMSLTAQRKAVAGVLSEGDTKKGVSYLRPINESIFYQHLKRLDQKNRKDAEDIITMETHYTSLDSLLTFLKSQRYYL